MMSAQLLLMITAVLLSAIVTLIGYWLRQVHREIKEAIKQLTAYIYELNKTVMMLETHINKGIEQGISNNKEKITELQDRIEKLEDE